MTHPRCRDQSPDTQDPCHCRYNCLLDPERRAPGFGVELWVIALFAAGMIVGVPAVLLFA